jgi:4-hydroxythreonine-4-phosphate dehydrogenase
MPNPGPCNTNGRPLIGITMGDPLGVGPEVTVKALADADLRAQARFIIFGLHDVLAVAADLAEVNSFWWREPYEYGARVGSGVLVADFDDLPAVRVNGTRAPEAVAGEASYRFVEEGVRSLKAGLIDALVTAPISKQAWKLAGHRAVGHTQVLADMFETRRVTMAFVADRLRVALASTHVPLFELRNRFTIGLVHQPIDLLDRALREWFNIEHPRIGVLGLNPHAGEGGILGDEEQRIIEPAMAMARSAQIDVTGPLPPDTAFAPHVAGQFDGLVAMYHDQGLIPVKALAFHRAVQLTLGLGVIRTSPDHGTAFDVAGKNRANSGSMREAIRLAIELARIRQSQRAPAVEMT